MLSGYKTYAVAILMLAHAVSAYFLGYSQDLNLNEVLNALGLAALRAGVAAK